MKEKYGKIQNKREKKRVKCGEIPSKNEKRKGGKQRRNMKK